MSKEGDPTQEQEQSSTASTELDPATARAVRATELAWQAVESEFGLLSSSEVDTLLGAHNAHRAYAADLRRRGELLCTLRNNSYVFPGFQFDHSAGTVRDWVAPLLVLAERYERGTAGMIMWMMSPTTYFEEEDRPVDHVDDAHRVLDVAEKAWGVEW
jgi:hypothetical protein